MRARRFAVLGLLAAAFGACTLLTQFDPEGQPCDPSTSDPELECLSDAGYWCVRGLCKKGPPPVDYDGGDDDGGAVDGGMSDGGFVDSGFDGGLRDGGTDGGSDGGKTDGGADAGKTDGGKKDGGDGG